MHNLAWVDYTQGRYTDGEAIYKKTIELRRRVLGPEHLKTLLSERNLGDLYLAQGRQAEAEALLKQILETSRRRLGPDHPDTLAIAGDLGGVYVAQRNYRLAETYEFQAVEGKTHRLGPDHADTLNSEADLVSTYLLEGKFDEAEPRARKIVEINRRKQPNDVARFRAETLLGAVLSGEKKFAEAEPLLLGGLEGLQARKAEIAVPDRSQLEDGRKWIIEMYQSSGQSAKALAWRKDH
jgi:tetratricopeptide (TPR) repeat protein